MTGHEIGRIALTVVAELLPELESRNVRHGKQFDLVAGRLERGSNEPLVLPREAAEENRDRVALRGRERPFDRPMEMRAPALRVLFLEAAPLFLDPALDLALDLLP